MATLTSHVLNSVTGVHAAKVGIALYPIVSGQRQKALFTTRTDAGGRMREAVALDTNITCELVFQIGEYFSQQSAHTPHTDPILREVVVRLELPDLHAAYHVPLLIAPHSYSMWCSQQA